jgi:hypothetical protein
MESLLQRLALPAGVGLIFCSVVSGCSADNALKAGEDGVAFRDDTGSVGDGADDTADAPQPAWFAPRAVVGVVEGVPVLRQLSLQIVDVDLQTVICQIDVPAESGVAAVSPDVSAALWLDVTIAPQQGDCTVPPATLGLGIGEIPGDVRAQLGPSGLADVADSIYGAFSRSPNDSSTEVAAFGYAGTPEDLAGDGPATLPPPDGEYVLNPLFLSRLPAGG